MCLQIYLRFTSLHHSPHPSPLFLKNNFNRCHSFIFIYEYKTHTPHSPFPYALPYPTGTHPRKRPVLSSCPFFFKCIVYSPRGFHFGISDLYMSCFNQINPISCSPIIQYLSVHCMIFIYRWVSIFFIL
jgi:hypothetical protein